ncbi:hypothetical protein [Nocardioides massiliensis]|uniref:Uncharacterized protein n=1 Tax=Nocardioides massiliensis TaxID=1325935 RepID=A0ABT9NIX6_9ACTN|nr:hypothetical protein [Nocardioides massiliensis]MDP9820368.1 hypothetical protein [Nocardioides massiliensis]
MSTPTQVARPWRTTVRTIVQALIALAVMAPILVEATGLDPESLPWLVGVLAVAGAVARVSALPQVEAFLRRFVPWLAADPDDHRPDETGHIRIGGYRIHQDGTLITRGLIYTGKLRADSITQARITGEEDES